jgi:hypothetical protein
LHDKAPPAGGAKPLFRAGGMGFLQAHFVLLDMGRHTIIILSSLKSYLLFVAYNKDNSPLKGKGHGLSEA